ncbi:unnamed protein product [Lactuca virosa]|uniref:Uncharacterized protein n=1 Tax=Lactuca virosa TaxID=75947 RepID=A0AAU9NSD6_9ASTR|nr:unnamed protein product [Lactuca virosa]
MAKNLEKRKREFSVPIKNVTVETTNKSDSDKYDIRIKDSYIVSPQKDTPFESNFEEIRISDVTTNISDIDENIDSGEHKNPIILKNENIIPSGISGIESVMVEVAIPDITVNLSNKDTKVETTTTSITPTSIVLAP